MSYTLRNQFSTALATTFLNDIQYQRNNYYYFLGKLEPWALDDRPPAAMQELSEAEDVAIRNNAAYFKKITPNDVTLVCSRYDWTSGTVYAQWDDTLDMSDSTFYVLTDENRVYKCLNNGAGAASTVKPTGRNLQPFKTADGYTWKYMYTIPSFKRTRFTSVNYMPVQRALSESFYSQGSVESVSIISGGSGYTDNQQTFITVSGTTTGSGATATFSVNEAGAVTGVTVTNGGTGYTAGVRVTIASNVGENVVLRATVVDGVVTAVTIINPGVGYSTSFDSVQFSVGGANLIPVISRSTGSILDVLILDAGAGYVSEPTLTLSTTVAADVSGAYTGNSTALLEAVIDNGSIQRVLIRDPGLNYPSATDTSIVVQGDGFGLDLSPVIVDGEIVDVIVENAGYAYTNLVVSVVGSGTGAVLRPIFANSDVTSDQSVIEQVSVDGAIYAIVVTNGGTGYNNTTQVIISGDGTGATAHCEVVGNTVQKVIMDSWGSGYTKATISFVDVNRNNQFNEFVDAEAYAIFPPGNGHGTDAVKELFGRTVAISSSIRTDPILTQYDQDYRQFGIVSQPRNMISNKSSTVDFDFNTYKVVFDNVIDLTVDSVLVLDALYRYRVVFIESASVYLQPLQKSLVEPVGTLVSESDITKTYRATEILARPIINKHSGNLLYISNEQPFEFSDAQGLLIKTYIRF